LSVDKIAKLAKVSIATVSRVFNKPDLVAKKTRDKVLKVAQELEYNKNNLPFSKIQKINEIGAIIPNLSNTYFARILEGIMKQAKILQLPTTLYLSHDNIEDELDAVDRMIEKQIKGVILIRTNNEEKSNRTINKLNEHKIPFVLADRDLTNNDYSGIFLSNAKAVYDAVSMLLKDSYEKIYIITGPQNNLNSNQRLDGYKEALKDYNIQIKPEMIYRGDFSIENGFALTSKILEQKNLPEVIFSCSNDTTVGAIKAINQKGLKLGKDIKLFSFIKLNASYINNFDIFYIQHPAQYMGERSVTILKNKLVGVKGLIREVLDYKIHY